MDFDQNDDYMVECPYNSSHKMPKSRLPWHLLNKCKTKVKKII